MSTEIGTSTESVVTEVTPAAAAPIVEQPTVDEPKVFDAEYVKGLREEAAGHRVEKQKEATAHAATAAKLKAFEDALLTETERTQKEFEETRSRADKNESRARELEVNYQLALASVDPANAIGDVKAAIKLIDRDSLEFDASGKITNLQAALETLKTEYPSVVASTRTPSAPNTGVTAPAKTASAKKITREELAILARTNPAKVVALTDAGELNHLL